MSCNHRINQACTNNSCRSCCRSRGFNACRTHHHRGRIIIERPRTYINVETDDNTIDNTLNNNRSNNNNNDGYLVSGNLVVPNIDHGDNGYNTEDDELDRFIDGSDGDDINDDDDIDYGENVDNIIEGVESGEPSQQLNEMERFQRVVIEDSKRNILRARKENIVFKTSASHEKLQNIIQTALADILKVNDKMVSELDESDDSTFDRSCHVCFEVADVIPMCGHVICFNCSEKLIASKKKCHCGEDVAILKYLGNK